MNPVDPQTMAAALRGSASKADTVEMTVPLLIRLMEHAREDLPEGEKGDLEIHHIVERAVRGRRCLDMDDYDSLTK